MNVLDCAVEIANQDVVLVGEEWDMAMGGDE